jgi:hypothetical protein
MKSIRTGVVVLLVVGLAVPAFAGDLASSIATAAERAGSPGSSVEQEEARTGRGSSKGLVWTGSALFAGGMAVGLFAFIKNQNGSYAEFGEADAVNKKVGAAGLAAAFAGGTLVFLGSHRAKRAPSVTVGPGRVGVAKRLSW